MPDDRFRVVVLDDYERFCTTVPAYREAAGLAEIRVVEHKLTTDDEWSEAVGDAHAVMLMRERSAFREREFGLAPSLRFVSQIGRGIPHLDLAEATRRGIVVSCTPNDSGASTVELTIALLTALARQIPSVSQGMREGAWPPAVGMLLEGRTLGVIGLGRIGARVARIARAMDMNLLAMGKTLTDERAAEAGARRVSLNTLLDESDIVTVHCRLNAETRGLIGRRELQRMKPGALLINTARGPIISEEALVESLRQGHPAGVGLDVYDEEPLPPDHPLRSFDNVILASHRGYAVDRILHQRYQAAFTNVIRFIEGAPVDIINPEAAQPPPLDSGSSPE